MEVRLDGEHEAGPRRQAEHQERAEGGAQQANDREPPEVGPAGPRTPGRRSQGAWRITRPRAGGPDAGAALRAGEEGRHPRPVTDGEVGTDQGASPVAVASDPTPPERPPLRRAAVPYPAGSPDRPPRRDRRAFPPRPRGAPARPRP